MATTYYKYNELTRVLTAEPRYIIAQQQCNSAAVFHLADGDYDYQGNPISA